MGKYHPHGDTSIYDAMVRMAQDFSLRDPLVDGHGNFGSLDGDAAAAYRYTECRLAPLADGAARRARAARRSTSARTTTARTASRSCCRRASRTCWSTARTGIAVGMATNIPPHNLGEVVRRAGRADRRPEARDQGSAQVHQGPGLPDRRPDPQREEGAARDLRDRAGRRSACAASGRSRSGKRGGQQIVITSIPYAVQQGDLVEKIAEVIRERKLPHAGRRARRVDRRRAHRARAQEGRRPGAGDGVPLQAHAAADELPRQPDLPGADATTRRSARRSGSISKAMLQHFLDFRLEVVDQAASSSSSPSCEKRHPHPRGLREDLRRARRGDPHHPQVRRQGRTPPRS